MKLITTTDSFNLTESHVVVLNLTLWFLYPNWKIVIELVKNRYVYKES